jgi:hypothetical protein
MSCSSALSGVTCSFSPATYTLDGSDKVLTGTVTIAASSSAAVAYPRFNRENSSVVAAAIFWLPGVLGLLFVTLERKRIFRNSYARNMLLLLVALLAVAGISSCGGGGTGSGTAPPVTGTMTITAGGSAGGVGQSLQLTVTVE